ncbi:hypothetical protein [Microbulbifer sp. 2205BS26-8]|uniref:hypothetical protein n=1 Tax=Microbulbifer sp. 2205BS26-8 TaxID=3064386 RepID=UPI00273DE511|nr:hypothetical protein [Microbulbifer sp. 2205BS26-8]MDP5211320.1 hypothetical protein [Microbulbifer sp. 2205BS26-8]
MKKFITAVSLTIAATGFAGLANAETWAPLNTNGIVVANAPSTPISVSKGITLACDMSGMANIDAAGSAEISALSLSGSAGLCGSIGFFNFPYAMEGGANDVVTIKNVDVQGITGNCLGDLVGTLDQATGEITFTMAQIPANPSGGAPCEVNGTVATTPAVSYTP